jgi:hypothetical protein
MSLFDEITRQVEELNMLLIEPDSVLIGIDARDEVIETAMDVMRRPPVFDLIAFKDLSKPIKFYLMGLQVYRSPDFSGIKVFKK